MLVPTPVLPVPSILIFPHFTLPFLMLGPEIFEDLLDLVPLMDRLPMAVRAEVMLRVLDRLDRLPRKCLQIRLRCSGSLLPMGRTFSMSMSTFKEFLPHEVRRVPRPPP